MAKPPFKPYCEITGEAINMKHAGPTKAEIYHVEQLRLKLRTAQQADAGAVTAYNEALAEMRNLVENNADHFSFTRGDKWQDKRDHPPKDALQNFMREWHIATLKSDRHRVRCDHEKAHRASGKSADEG